MDGENFIFAENILSHLTIGRSNRISPAHEGMFYGQNVNKNEFNWFWDMLMFNRRLQMNSRSVVAPLIGTQYTSYISWGYLGLLLEFPSLVAVCNWSLFSILLHHPNKLFAFRHSRWQTRIAQIKIDLTFGRMAESQGYIYLGIQIPILYGYWIWVWRVPIDTIRSLLLPCFRNFLPIKSKYKLSICRSNAQWIYSRFELGALPLLMTKKEQLINHSTVCFSNSGALWILSSLSFLDYGDVNAIFSSEMQMQLFISLSPFATWNIFFSQFSSVRIVFHSLFDWMKRFASHYVCCRTVLSVSHNGMCSGLSLFLLSNYYYLSPFAPQTMYSDFEKENCLFR